MLAAVSTLAIGVLLVAAPRWSTDAPVPFWIQGEGGRQRDRDLVRRALGVWSDATGGSLRFEESELPPARGIRVVFTRDLAHFGFTMPKLDGDGRVLRADVIVVTDPVGDPLQKQLIVYLTAVHELGHALGLPHSDRIGEIMYAFGHPMDPERVFFGYRKKLRSAEDIGGPEATGLSEADRRAIRQLYPAPEP